MRFRHRNPLDLLLLVLPALLIATCRDELGPVSTQRWIYYPVSTFFNSPPEKAGLYRYSLVNRKTELVAPSSVSVVSCVGRNGDVSFGYDASAVSHWWGWVEEKSVPIPLPATDDPEYGYGQLWPSLIAQSLDGIRAAHTLVRSPVTPGIPEKITHRIALLDRSSGETRILDFQDFARREMAAAGVTLGRIYGSLFFTTERGEALLFEITGLKLENGLLREAGRLIAQWSNGTFTALMPPDTSAPNSDGYTTLTAYAPGSGTMILRRRQGGTQKFIARGLGSAVETPLPFPSNTTFTRHQFSHVADEMVWWGVNGIELRRPSDGSVLSYPIIYSDVDRLFGPQQYGQIKNLSLSPDGEWILFGAIPAGDPNRTGVDLFAARRDGSDLQKIATDVHTFDGAISVTLSK